MKKYQRGSVSVWPAGTMATNAGATTLIVALGGVAQTRVAFNNNPWAGVRLLNSGGQYRVLSGVEPGGVTWTNIGLEDNWSNISKAPADTTWTVRATEVSADAGWAWAAAADSFGSWLNLDTTRFFYGSNTGSGGDIETASLKLEISDDGGSTVLTTTTGTLSSEYTV